MVVNIVPQTVLRLNIVYEISHGCIYLALRALTGDYQVFHC